MKYAIATDRDGYKKRSLIKDTDGENEAQFGIPAGPPDIRKLDWDSILREINHILVECGSFSWDDVQRNPAGVQAALSTFKRALITMYRQEDQERKGITE